MKGRILVYALPAFILTTIHLAEAQLTKITVGYPAIAAGHLPAWLAKEAGIFAKNGLDVQLVYFRGGNPGCDGLAIEADPDKSGGRQHCEC